ncbi:MAG TPA: hypothetical protein PKY81_03030 [bacterium]|nr:hypothetical protein [bacterium]HPN29911.1 hypothetical protein [bacterium]
MRKKVFIIHGHSISFQEALKIVIEAISAKIYYYDKKYYALKEISRFIRYAVYETADNKFVKQLERLLVTKIVISEFYQDASFKPDDSWVALSDYMIKNKLSGYEVKKTEKEKKEFCETLFTISCGDFAKIVCCPEPSKEGILQYLKYFHDSLGNDTEGKYLEKEAEEFLRKIISENGGNADAFVEGLKEIIRNSEAGGDLDTIGSNSLYGYWALNAIPAETGEYAVYGRDFEFDFINYHEGLKHLNLRYKNCDIYIPDFPIDAIPDLKDDIEALMECGNFVQRFDDHHPYSKESKDALEYLLNSGKIGFYAMSGYLEGTPETPKDLQKCGTDMIYEGLILNTNLDSDYWKEFTRLAHIQDLHIMEDKAAIDFSKLIGSKYSKLDMVQQIMQLASMEDLKAIFERTGWGKKISDYESELEKVCPKLEEGMGFIEYSLPLTSENKTEYFSRLNQIQKIFVMVGKIFSFGLYDMTNFFHKYDKSNIHRILLVLSPFQSSKEAKINVASAIHYFKNKFEFDYMFFCYGLSLMTTRKVNDKDKSLDLNELAGKIGAEDDGGHSEAATCKPSANKEFPKQRIQKVNSSNFGEYIRYIAMRLQKDFGFKIVKSDKTPAGFYKKN